MSQTPPPDPKLPSKDSSVPALFQPGGLSRELSRVLLLGFGIIGAYRYAHHIVPILLMFAMVFLLAIILNSVVAWLERRGVRRGVAVVAILLTFLGSIGVAGSLIVPPALEEANALATKAPKYWSTIKARAREMEKRYPALRHAWPQLTGEEAAKSTNSANSANSADSANGAGTSTGNSNSVNAASESVDGAVASEAAGRVSDAAAAPPSKSAAGEKQDNPLQSFLGQDALLRYARQALAITTGLLGAIFVTVLSLLLLMFTLANPQALVAGALCAVPDEYREPARRSLARIFTQMTGWARATIINGTITGTLTGVGLALVGVPSALVLGICAFFGEFVPNVGPLVMAVPAIFVALSISPAKALAAFGVIVFVQAVASNALNPLIMGREMKLHPVTITFFALSMGSIFGVAGAILAVPTAATAKILFEEFYLLPRRVPQGEIEQQARDIVNGQAGVENPDTEKPAPLEMPSDETKA